MPQKYRNACFTSYKLDAVFTEWTEEEHPESIRFLCYQKEKCPTTERIHYQGYVEVKKAYRLKALQTLLGDPTMHVEPRRGTPQEAAAYCRKEASRVQGTTFVEFGELGGHQGKRSDLAEVADMVMGGSAVSTIARDNPTTFIRYGRGIRDLAFIAMEERSKEFRKLKVLVLWGEAGCGKTRAACFLGKNDWFIMEQPNAGTLWWDGYNGESTIIIDDFYGWVKYATLLRLLDGHRQRLAIKGGFTYALWTRVVITSNKPPRDWYSHGMTPALQRRINMIVHMDHPLDFEEPMEAHLTECQALFE